MVSSHHMPNSLALAARDGVLRHTIVKLLENRQIELKIGTSSTSRGRWPAEALAGVIEVRDHEDAEDGRLRRDQAPHADAPAQFVREWHFGLR